MKQHTNRLLIAGTLGILLVSGCSSQGTYRAYETTAINNDGAMENRMVEEYVGPDKKRVISKQVVREKVSCVAQDGRTLPAKSVSDCMKRKGKIVDEVFQEEKIIKAR